jgi:hypothetical protein
MSKGYLLGGYYFLWKEFIAPLNYIIFKYYIFLEGGWIILKFELQHIPDSIFFINFFSKLKTITSTVKVETDCYQYGVQHMHAKIM